MSISVKSLFNQICYNMHQTEFYGDDAQILPLMVIKRDKFRKQISHSHAIIEFPDMGKFILSLKKVGD